MKAADCKRFKEEEFLANTKFFSKSHIFASQDSQKDFAVLECSRRAERRISPTRMVNALKIRFFLQNLRFSHRIY